MFIHDTARAGLVLADLKTVGVNVALDDFGTGYSSLIYLQRFPIDIVKIDRLFTSKLAPDNPTAAIVKAIIELAHALDKTVVGEGVETAEQHDQLAALGCEYCQGFFFHRPMTIDNLEHQLQARSGHWQAIDGHDAVDGQSQKLLAPTPLPPKSSG